MEMLLRACVLLLGLVLMPLTVSADVFSKMFERSLEEAQAGSADSMYEVGRLYDLGVGVKADKSESLNWYRKAADKGHPRAMFKLGEAYYRGLLVERDYGKAHQYFLGAAKGGVEEAREYLARMYELGLGVAKDPTAAAAWLNPDTEEPVATEEPAPSPPPVADKPKETAKPAAESAPARKEQVKQETAKKELPKKQEPAKQEAPPTPIQMVRRGVWNKQNRPALYLPSESTKCQQWGNELICTSKKLRGQQYSTPYLYRVQSTLRGFADDGSFTIDYQFMLDEIQLNEVAGYGAEPAKSASPGSIAAELRERASSLSCRVLNPRALQCQRSLGEVQNFENAK